MLYQILLDILYKGDPCLYMCNWCFSLRCLFQCLLVCLFVLLFYFVFIPFLYLFIVYTLYTFETIFVAHSFRAKSKKQKYAFSVEENELNKLDFG
jgi:hypothetical protein